MGVYMNHYVNESTESESSYRSFASNAFHELRGYLAMGLVGLAIATSGFLACKDITEPNAARREWFNEARNKCLQIRKDEARGNYFDAVRAENELRSDIRQRKIVNNWGREFEIIERDLDTNKTKSADYGQPLD